MNFNSILENDLFNLPKSYNNKTTFRKYLKSAFDEYINILKKIDPSIIQVKGFTKKNNLKNIIERQEDFINGILETIDLYYDGKPAAAYFTFKKIIDKRRTQFKTMLLTNSFEINQDFYRIRINKENFPFADHEMFHIDFANRGKVSTQRYSIPGFPSLYLAKTLYVAWEELNRPNINDFQAVRLSNKEPIKYLDLTSSNVNFEVEEISKENYKYIMTFPLIIACSIKVKDTNSIFKPEYIIPQILLQWIRENEDIDAIKYSSTHLKYDSKKLDDDLFNIVLPVKENKDRGLCSRLKNTFNMSDIISKQLIDFSSGGDNFFYDCEESAKIDKKISSLEIIKGKRLPYSHSILGRMELLLENMPTNEIV